MARYVTAPEFAAAMGVHVKTLHRWLKEDPAAFPDRVRDPGVATRKSKPFRWRRDDVEEFLEKNGHAPLAADCPEQETVG